MFSNVLLLIDDIAQSGRQTLARHLDTFKSWIEFPEKVYNERRIMVPLDS